ncbi:DEAD/DEAH box helicase [Ceratobasidium sp. AG-Ba]|nr:DEAD/DEAH box helicase [Ceratobasidium sp. AG-Ba]
MALRLVTQARFSLRPCPTPFATLRAALAQRAALAPLPTRTFAAARPLLSLHAAQAHHTPVLEVSGRTEPDFSKTSAKNVEVEGSHLVPFSEIKQLVTEETYDAITVKPYRLTHMTPVQAAVLPLLPQLTKKHDELESVNGKLPARDLLVRAKTGTGKTLAFLVPAIEARINAIERVKKEALEKAGLAKDRTYETRAARAFTRTDVGTLIISPTRELATQIANEALKLTHHHGDFEVRLFVGGNSKREQMRGWMKGRRDIVVATPGRLRDLLQSEPGVAEGFKNTQMLILDEADTLLDMGFRDDLEDIISYLPQSPERQTMLYSATVSRAIQQVARQTLDKNHLFINTVTEEDSPVHSHIPQYHTILPKAEDQIPHILRLLAHDQLSNPGKSKSIVFLPTTRMTQMYAQLLRELARDALPAGRTTQVYEIHSKKDQEQRSRTSDRFRKDSTGAAILVSSDVSARGVDYPGVTRVIQVGIPSSSDQYVHRVGRTGRAGTEGRGDLVLLPWEIGFVTWQLTHVPMKATTVKEVEAQTLHLAAKHDDNPNAFYTPPPVPRHLRTAFRGSVNTPTPATFSPKITPKIQQIEANIKEVLPQLDPLMVDETFASLLGYYIAKGPELRVSKGVILQGCKDWATGAAGLPEEPHISNAFLQKLGFDDGRTKRFGQARVDYKERRSSSPWAVRGSQRGRDRSLPLPDRRRSFENQESEHGARNEFSSQEGRGFKPRNRGFDPNGENDIGGRDRFGSREFGDDRRERRFDRRDNTTRRRSFNLEDPENADEYRSHRYGKSS